MDCRMREWFPRKTKSPAGSRVISHVQYSRSRGLGKGWHSRRDCMADHCLRPEWPLSGTRAARYRFWNGGPGPVAKRLEMTSPPPKFFAIMALALTVPVLAGPAPAAGQATDGAGSLLETSQPYEVHIAGEPDPIPGEVRDLLAETSTLVQLKDKAPPSLVGLRRRAETDDDRLQAALRSLGYYDGQVDIRIDPEVQPARVTIGVEAGPRYEIAKVEIVDPDGRPVPGATAGRIGVEPGQPALAASVVDGEAHLLNWLAEEGHAYARVTERRALVDHARRVMEVSYVVSAGPVTRLGTVTFRGLDRLQAASALRRVPWQPGVTRYSPKRLEDFRNDLTELGVFSSVRVRLAEEAEADGTASVIVDVKERDRRYIALGVSYSTSDGIGATATWGHRNLLGGGERLELSTSVGGIARSGTSFGRIDYKVAAKYRQPDFLSRNQFLLLGLDLLSESPDAYDRRAAVATAAVERHFSRKLVGSAGITSERSQIVERSGRRTDNTLLGLPVTLAWDRSDDLLNPTRGFRLNSAVTPYVAAFGGSDRFTPIRAGGSLYIPLSADGHTVWASRALMGAIIGNATLTVPADKRFYAGGGGSVRGYGFQQIGPKDATGQPIGGRSLVEVGTELRFRVTENIGLVPFVDGGNVYDTEYPRLAKGLRWGAGIGARYHTGFGPFRLDFGFPIGRRPGESSWQLYLSLGQAF